MDEETDHVLDASVLAQLERDATEARLPRLIEIYIGELGRRTQKIAAALESGDVYSIEYETHALRSSSGTFGAVKLQALAADTEQACLDGNSLLAETNARSLLKLSEITAAALRDRYPKP